MPRFPVKQKNIEGNETRIEGTDYRHLVKVLRLREGDPVILFDECSKEYTGKIRDIGRRDVVIDILSSRTVETESPLNIILLQGLPKGDKMDYIVEKATELGVRTIVPVRTERSLANAADKKNRWERIAVEASKQCGRTRPPVIENTLIFAEAINYNKDGALPIILHVDSKCSIKDYLKYSLQLPNTIIILIGPEGGFSEEEVLLASVKGFTSLGLGPRTLRTETASIAVLSIIQFHHGDL
jgi:16S rRNA (uracil1498-N3)-methyltransferase